jgi:hypothetical protein
MRTIPVRTAGTIKQQNIFVVFRFALISFNPFEVDDFFFISDVNKMAEGEESGEKSLWRTQIPWQERTDQANLFSISAVAFILFWKVETARKLQETFFRLIFFKRGQFVCLTLFEGRTNLRKTSPKLIFFLVAQASPPSIEPGD